MFRYLQASSSQTEGIALPATDGLKLSASAVVIEEETFHERLGLAEDRLRAIAPAGRSPLPVVRQLKYQTMDRLSKHEPSPLQSHLQQISRHLKEIEKCWEARELTGERYYELKYLESVQRLHQLQVCHSKQILRLESMIKQEEQSWQAQLDELRAKHSNEVVKLRTDHQQEVEQLMKERQEQLRQQHLTTERTFLEQQNKLFSEIDLLQATLQGELEQHAKTQTRLNEVEQQHIKEICRLQTQVETLESQLKRTSAELQVQRNLKTEGLVRLREQESCLEVTKRNNERFSSEINQLKTQLSESVREATEACELAKSTLQKIAFFTQKSSSTTIVQIRQQIRLGIAEVQQRAEILHRKDAQENTSTVCSTFRTKPPADRLSELIAINKENSHYECNVSADFAGSRLHRKTRSVWKNDAHQDSQLRLPEDQTYRMLLVQAQQIQSLL